MRISISVAALPSFEVMISYARKSGRCWTRSEEHTSELQSRSDLVCRLLLEKKKQWELQALAVPRLTPFLFGLPTILNLLTIAASLADGAWQAARSPPTPHARTAPRHARCVL